MFTYQHIVKLHDTDAYGIIFFPNQLRICHDALQACWRDIGFPLLPRREQMPVLPVVVHAECDYAAPISVDDVLRVELSLEAIGRTSFTLRYRIVNQHAREVGRARTVHVAVDPGTSEKMMVPEPMRKALERIAS